MSYTLLQNNDFLIDEKVGMFKFENQYKIFNDEGHQLGRVQQRMTLGQKFLRMIISPAALPFKIEIYDEKDSMILKVSRGWTFWMSKIAIEDAQGMILGYIKQKFKLFTPKFEVLDSQNMLLAELKGDWKAWDFQLKNSQGQTLATINKKWNGAMKELFTTADKYRVSIDGNLVNDTLKKIILSSAITIDMVLKERK
jgi:uncharacterized protein YxjI